MAPYARRLVGVDLSGRMLARARERKVYDELVKGELTAYLGGCNEAFDLVVSADTLVYFGRLKVVVSAAAQALRPDGRVIFTVEELVEDGRGAGYSLGTSGRYRHSNAYLERVLEDAGFRPEIVPAELRLEGGEPVAGLVVLGTKPAARGASSGRGRSGAG
jgi:predicted TPR repeat methyltransferase